MAVLKDNSGNTAGASKFGGASGVRRYTASKFVPDADWTVESVDIRINEDTGSPHSTQDVIVKILGNIVTLPDDSTVLGTVTKTGASIGAIGSLFTDYNLTLSASLTSGVTYWLALEISTTGDDANYWSSRGITTASLGNGAKFDEDDSGIWVVNTDDLFYKINGTASSSGISSNNLTLLGVS
jgi:hypothetical protein